MKYKMKIKERKVIKIQYYTNCPKCTNEIKGTAKSQVEWNLSKHLDKCKGKSK